MNSVKCGARRSTYQSPSADSQRRHDATSNARQSSADPPLVSTRHQQPSFVHPRGPAYLQAAQTLLQRKRDLADKLSRVRAASELPGLFRFRPQVPSSSFTDGVLVSYVCPRRLSKPRSSCSLVWCASWLMPAHPSSSPLGSVLGRCEPPVSQRVTSRRLRLGTHCQVEADLRR